MKYFEFFRQRIADLPSPNERGEVVVKCIFHADDSPSLSLNVETGKFRCFAPHCPAHRGGGYRKFDDFIQGSVPGVMVSNEPIPEPAVEGYHAILLHDKERLEWLQKQRGLTLDTITKFKIGWDSSRYTIPIYEDGKLVNVRKYLPGQTSRNDKVINYGVSHGRPRLFPELPPKGDVFLFEGEMDTLLGRQLGFPAHTVTSGAGQWHDGLTPLFKDRVVFIVYDVDKAGANGAAVIGQKLLKVAARVNVVRLPLPGTKELKDFTNLFHDRGVDVDQSRKEFAEALAGAQPVVAEVSESREPEREAAEIHLSQIGREQFVGKRIGATVLVAGKDLAPFQVPRCITYQCEGGEKICGGCGINRAGLTLKKEFAEWDSQLLEMVNVPVEKLESIIAQAAEVPFKCRRFTYEVKQYANVESIKAIPEIDFASAEAEYVIRNLFYLGHGLEANKTYRIEAVVMPEPKTQYATALIYKAEQSQDSIEKFTMDDDMHAKLKLFQVSDAQP